MNDKDNCKDCDSPDMCEDQDCEFSPMLKDFEFNIIQEKLERRNSSINKALPQEERSDPLNVQIGGNHYVTLRIQPIEFILANNFSFLQGCIIKRIARYTKDKKGIQDLEKIKHECDFLIEEIKKELQTNNLIPPKRATVAPSR